MNAGHAPNPRARRLVGFCIGAALLAAAIIAITRNADQFHAALAEASRAAWWLIALAITLPLANWLIMSLSFWILMRRHGAIELWEMSCLIGAAWLLNYLPLRPGLVGRVAYHKAVNNISITHSVKVTVVSLACAGVAILMLLGAVAAAAGSTTGTQILVIALAPTLLGSFAVLACLASRRPWHIALTVVLRYLDLLVWSARYLVVFAIIGRPLSPAAAAAIASIGQIAMLVPFVGNGLGLREWAVGATANALPTGLLSASGRLTTTAGLLADLVNRVAELCCAIPIGLLSAIAISTRKSLSGKVL